MKVNVNKKVNRHGEVCFFYSQGKLALYKTIAKDSVLEIPYYSFKHISKRKYDQIRLEQGSKMPSISSEENLLRTDEDSLREYKQQAKTHSRNKQQADIYDKDVSSILPDCRVIDQELLHTTVIFVGEKTGAAAKKYVEKLLSWGAAQLFYSSWREPRTQPFELQIDDIIVELPVDPKLRKKYFEEAAKRNITNAFDPVFDNGQKYLSISQK